MELRKTPEMKILIAASEMAPYVKTGGLGDVVGALPEALARLGHQVKVFVPLYRAIDERLYSLRPLDWTANITVNGRPVPVSLETRRHRRLPLETCFVENTDYFGRRDLYRDPATGTDYSDNDERFIFFARAVLESLRRIDFKPDIIHVHDWQAALIPVYLKTTAAELLFSEIKTVLTIHNLAHQGVFHGERFPMLNLPPALFEPTASFEFYEQVNFMKAAIIYADKITTVSPRYAAEIQSSSELGCGLDGVLQQRRDDLVGILNGVDYSVWSPSRDRRIPHRYHINNLSGKRMNKVALLGRAGLPVRPRSPLIGIISRLVDQKGFDLIAAAADRLFEMDIQMVVLGTGEEKYHRLLADLERKYPDKLRVWLTFDEVLAHFIEAAADIFLMPSRFEPCGLNQMYSLKYGTVPVVREVGGLVDTVVDYDPTGGEGTGFVFSEYEPEAMLNALSRAAELYARPRQWMKLMKAGMRQDFSWARSARLYEKLFEQLLSE
ncbi:MAG: glycogen synthase GlgA [bacterium]